MAFPTFFPTVFPAFFAFRLSALAAGLAFFRRVFVAEATVLVPFFFSPEAVFLAREASFLDVVAAFFPVAVAAFFARVVVLAAFFAPAFTTVFARLAAAPAFFFAAVVIGAAFRATFFMVRMAAMVFSFVGGVDVARGLSEDSRVSSFDQPAGSRLSRCLRQGHTVFDCCGV